MQLCIASIGLVLGVIKWLLFGILGVVLDSLQGGHEDGREKSSEILDLIGKMIRMHLVLHLPA
jgi:hypothetical protein